MPPPFISYNISKTTNHLKHLGLLPCGDHSPLWMVLAAESIRVSVRFCLHHHPFLSWLPDPKSSTKHITSVWNRSSHKQVHHDIFKQIMRWHWPVISHDRQVQTVGRELYWWDLVLPVIFKVVAVDRKNPNNIKHVLCPAASQKTVMSRQVAQVTGHQDILSGSASDVNSESESVGCTFLENIGIKNKTPPQITWSKSSTFWD